MKKKEKQNIIKNNGSAESNEYKNLLIIIGIIAIVFLLFYLATILFTKDNHDDIFKQDLEASEIQYNEIIVGDMFNHEGEYYVLLIEENEPYKESFENVLSQARQHKTIYEVDLSNAFNKKYVKDEYNYSKDKFSTKGTVLLKIKDKSIKDHYTDKEKILNKLLELSK